MTRRSWTAKRRLALFLAHDRRCHICGVTIDGIRDPWDVEHIIPVAMGGDDDEANCAPAHKACHTSKTARDVAQIAKTNRVRAKHTGAKAATRNPLPGSKASKWKMTFNGAVLRNGGHE
jgi:5-methylcytosine-specific restriction protein A